MRVVELTMPPAWQSMIARLMPGERPKSSALTISRRSPDMPPRLDRPNGFHAAVAHADHDIVQVDRRADVAGDQPNDVAHLQLALQSVFVDFEVTVLIGPAQVGDASRVDDLRLPRVPRQRLESRIADGTPWLWPANDRREAEQCVLERRPGVAVRGVHEQERACLNLIEHPGLDIQLDRTGAAAADVAQLVVVLLQQLDRLLQHVHRWLIQ